MVQDSRSECYPPEGSVMAQKVVVTRWCDRPHKKETEAEGHPVTFTFDGREYEIDLCGPHKKETTDTFGALIEHARRVTRPARRSQPPRNRVLPAAVRTWYKALPADARAQLGLPPLIADHGRIPGQVVGAYRAQADGS